jgi:hypothetical protein
MRVNENKHLCNVYLFNNYLSSAISTLGSRDIKEKNTHFVVPVLVKLIV